MSDLKDREQHLRELNAYLDQKQNEVVRRAETLIKEQNEYLQNCVSVNVQKLQESENDLGLDSLDFDRMFETNEQSLASENIEQMSTGSTTYVFEDPLPRQDAPMPIAFHDNESSSALADASSTSKPIQNDTSDNQVEETVFTEENINTKAALRLQKARFKSLEKKYNDILDRFNTKEKEANRQSTRIKELEGKLKVSERKLHSEQQKSERRRERVTTLEQETEQLRAEVTSVRRELENTKKCLGKNQRNTRTSDVRLGRALEEAEKYRRMLQRVRNDSKTNVEVQRSEVDRLQQENKTLVKQKCELLNAFKKQVKLIDILKKQKAHLEAMKLLEFTEEQFIKTLEIGERLAT